MASPSLSDLDLSDWLAQAERDLERFERRLRRRRPRFRRGDRVSLFEDTYRVQGYEVDPRTGYALARAEDGLGPAALFLPLDMECFLSPAPRPAGPMSSNPSASL